MHEFLLINVIKILSYADNRNTSETKGKISSMRNKALSQNIINENPDYSSRHRNM